MDNEEEDMIYPPRLFKDPKIVKFLLIQDSNPWNKIFYMCGGCGHAIELRKIQEHAEEEHQADGVDLYEIAKEANTSI